MSEDQFTSLKKEITGIIKMYLQILTLVVAVTIGAFGWFAIDHMKLKDRHRDLTIDFGLSQGALHERFPESAVFEPNYNKYIVKRGE